MITKFHNTNLSGNVFVIFVVFLSVSVRHHPHICMSLSAHTHFHTTDVTPYLIQFSNYICYYLFNIILSGQSPESTGFNLIFFTDNN
jgi:hypothetical protein